MTTPEEEVQQLREAVARLTAENAQLTQGQHQNQHVPPANPDATSHENEPEDDDEEQDDYRENPQGERVVYIPKDRKCPLFSGRGELTAREWIEEVRSAMHSRHMSVRDQAQFVYDHLTGQAKDEIKYRPRGVRDHPKRMFDILLEQFNNTKSLIVLKERFYARKQQEGESLREFSNALFSLVDEMTQSCPAGVAGSDRLLVAQFVEYVRDGHLSRELKRIVREHPEYDLHDVRDEAIRWEKEGRYGEGLSQDHLVPLAYSIQQKQTGAAPSATAEWAELREMIRAQQGQIQELTQVVRESQNPPRQQRSSASQQFRTAPQGPESHINPQPSGN